jgi:AraC-like DNA-binding protein
LAISLAKKSESVETPEAEWTAGERTVARLVAVMRDVGLDVQDLLGRANITCSLEAFSTGAFRQVSPDRLHRLRSLAGGALAAHVAIKAGREPLRPHDYRMLFFCLVSCRTLRQAMQRAGEFVSVLNGRCGRMELIESSDTAEFRIDSQWPFRTVPSFVVDMIGILSQHSLFGWLIGHTVPITVLTEYPASMLPAFSTGMLPYPIVTGCTTNGFRFPAEYLDYPVLRTGEDCEAAFGADLAFLFSTRQDGTRLELSEKVRRILFQALTDGQEPPPLDTTAAMVGQSSASFRRQLSRKGLSYRGIKDSCRREIAMDLLSRTNLSIEDIAERLSFCDSDAFRRAFGQWIGMAPSQFRKLSASRR